MRRLNRKPSRFLIYLLAATMVLTGCAGGIFKSKPAPGGADAAGQLAAALAAGSINDLPLAGDRGRAILDYQQATGALDGIRPRVEVGTVDYSDSGTEAIVQLNQSYDFDQGSWSYTSSAPMSYLDNQWQIEWSPSIVHPKLTQTTRLHDERTSPHRGAILDNQGFAIVEDRPVYRVGIDKTLLDPEQFESSARALAELVEIDADPYIEQVMASGPQAFVLAITLREGQVPAELDSILGAIAIGTTLPLAPSSTFARGLLGTVGEATAEDIAEGNNKIAPGDIVGKSGLQGIHDADLRGLPGHTVSIIERSESQLEKLPPQVVDPEPQPSSSPDTSSTSNSPTADRKVLFAVAPVNGTPLQLTLDTDLQRKAESIVAPYGDNLVMLVVLDKTTGGVLAAADSPAAGVQSFSTSGAYPPGSTMKLSSSLALIRQGYTADSSVDCSSSATINGRVFKNHPAYPTALTGMVPLDTAVAASCNTAFLNASREISAKQFRSAAASLGLGVDYDTGFGAFYGSVPEMDDPVEHAAGMIGQGQVLMSPLALTAEAASVANGRTTIPYLVEGLQPTSTAQPLSAEEAAILRDLMEQVVTRGTATQMNGILQGAKTGTAEFGDASQSHSWIVGWNDQYAICAMSYNGDGADKQAVIDFIAG